MTPCCAFRWLSYKLSKSSVTSTTSACHSEVGSPAPHQVSIVQAYASDVGSLQYKTRIACLRHAFSFGSHSNPGAGDSRCSGCCCSRCPSCSHSTRSGCPDSPSDTTSSAFSLHPLKSPIVRFLPGLDLTSDRFNTSGPVFYAPEICVEYRNRQLDQRQKLV